MGGRCGSLHGVGARFHRGRRTIRLRMPRQEKTADELTQLLQQRIDELDSVRTGAHVFAPHVYRCDPDEHGCNWNVGVYSGPPQYASVVRLIVRGLRKHYFLRDQPLPAEKHGRGEQQ